MNFIETFLGMPWNEYFTLWKTSTGLLFSQYMFLTVIFYIIFFAILAVSGGINTLANKTLMFFAVLLLFANPVVRLFGGIEHLLGQWGMQLPRFFS